MKGINTDKFQPNKEWKLEDKTQGEKITCDHNKL